MPQWPLSTTSDSSSGDDTTTVPLIFETSEPPSSNASPPRRPQRPSYVPSILDASKIQDHTPAFEYRQNQTQQNQPVNQNGQQPRYWDQGYIVSPNEPNTPGTGLSGTSMSSRPSTTSSFGSIPDFPVPTMPTAPPPAPAQPRKSIGPPPSARRGASSYYSQTSFVTPIPEEATESPKKQQHGSYASSHVIPKSWADGPPEYYMTSYTEEDEDDFDEQTIRESRSTDADENTQLVRQASMGRQYKPSLTTVRSNGDLGAGAALPRDAKPRIGMAGAISAAAGAAATGTIVEEGEFSRRAPEAVGSNAYVEPVVEDVRGSPSGPMPKSRSGAATPRNGPQDLRVRQILGGLEKGGALGAVEEASPTDARRPPRLDINAVRDAESRGSLTSLPDLIRRATKLASNLDKGRTASRLGMLEMFNTSDPNLLAKVQAANANNRNSSLSGMLSSFPAPAMTPTGDRNDAQWNMYDNSNRDLMTPISQLKPEQEKKRRRRCCGMPIWVFTFLLIVLLLVVAAAIVIPIVLIVLPRSNQTTATSASPTTNLATCSSSNPCLNGGISVVSDDSCQCVCTNKFSGASCTSADDGSCTAADVGSFKNATVGSDFPTVLSSASKFQISLNQTALLATLAAANMSCSNENALVSFSTLNNRRDVDALGSMAMPNAPRMAEPQAITSNGVVLASTAAPIPTAATVSGTAAAPTATSQTPSASQAAFAGVAVLWVLQQSLDLNTAALAQSALLSTFEKAGSTSKVNVGQGITVDLTKLTITVNGTQVGH